DRFWRSSLLMMAKKNRGAVACSEGSFRVPTSQGYFSPAYSVSRCRNPGLLFGDLDLADHFPRTDTEQRLHFLFDFSHERRAVLEVQLRILAPLTNLLSVVAVPRAGLVDDAGFRRDVEHQARVADAFRVHDVELGLLEGCSHLVLDHLHADV